MDTQRFFWDFEIQTEHLIPVRRLQLEIIFYKKNMFYSEFCRPKRATEWKS